VAAYLAVPALAEPMRDSRTVKDIPKEIDKLNQPMREAAQQLEFEQAAAFRDRIKKLEEMELSLG